MNCDSGPDDRTTPTLPVPAAFAKRGLPRPRDHAGTPIPYITHLHPAAPPTGAGSTPSSPSNAKRHGCAKSVVSNCHHAHGSSSNQVGR